MYVPVNQFIIGSDSGLSPVLCQAIIWTNDGLLLNGPLETNFSENWLKYQHFIKENNFQNVVWKWQYLISTSMC